jgi:hypothetical protein
MRPGARPDELQGAKRRVSYLDRKAAANVSRSHRSDDGQVREVLGGAGYGDGETPRERMLRERREKEKALASQHNFRTNKRGGGSNDQPRQTQSSPEDLEVGSAIQKLIFGGADFRLVDMRTLSSIDPFASVIANARAGAGSSSKMQLMQVKDALLSKFSADRLMDIMERMGLEAEAPVRKAPKVHAPKAPPGRPIAEMQEGLQNGQRQNLPSDRQIEVARRNAEDQARLLAEGEEWKKEAQRATKEEHERRMSSIKHKKKATAAERLVKKASAAKETAELEAAESRRQIGEAMRVMQKAQEEAEAVKQKAEDEGTGVYSV